MTELRDAIEALSAGIALHEQPDEFGDLVSSQDNASVPVHRWYSYKEAFSHHLPRRVLSLLGAASSGVVADCFGGVGTTALALQTDPRVECVLSVEYSPFAHFVGRTKLKWFELDPADLRRKARALIRFVERQVDMPELAAFHNREIFRRATLKKLLSARDRIARAHLSDQERCFFLLGLAATLEDLSGAMKDGRALRIRRASQLHPKALTPRVQPRFEGRDVVRRTLLHQWLAMIEDLDLTQTTLSRRELVKRAKHFRGDARALDRVRGGSGRSPFLDNSVGLFVYSPPYLNCIDYSEIYKIELWFLELIRTQHEFRRLRLGTLRSHPSIAFPESDHMHDLSRSAVRAVICDLAEFIEANHRGSGIGQMLFNYFDDMYLAWREQYRVLERGGHAVCVVANSTFSRREKRASGKIEEFWRVPVLTDVLLTRLAEAVGFEIVGIWKARDLRPRNVTEGAARESLVVVQKP